MKDTLSLIGAAAENNAIGYRGLIPWHIRADFQYFKRTTMGHTMIMGLGTWRSFHERCLPGRRNIVVTDQPLTEADKNSGAEFYSSPETALEAAAGDGEIFIIGGGMIYEQFLPMADKLYLTVINKDFEADTFFPIINFNNWELSEIQIIDDDPQIDCSYRFELWEKKR